MAYSINNIIKREIKAIKQCNFRMNRGLNILRKNEVDSLLLLEMDGAYKTLEGKLKDNLAARLTLYEAVIKLSEENKHLKQLINKKES